jgi:hypothetical protein
MMSSTTLVFLAAAWVGLNAGLVMLRLYVTAPGMRPAEAINVATSAGRPVHLRLVS